MLKILFFIVLFIVIISFRAESGPDRIKKGSRKSVFIFIIVILLLTGVVFYFLKMLKIAVFLWLALVIAVFIRFYLL